MNKIILSIETSTNICSVSLFKNRKLLCIKEDNNREHSSLLASFVDQLFHLNGHHDVVSKLMPNNLEQLAACLAIIRPAKRHLMHKDWLDILKEVWVRPSDGSYFFKKSHAIAYAHAIVVQLNLIARDKYSFDATSKN